MKSNCFETLVVINFVKLTNAFISKKNKLDLMSFAFEKVNLCCREKLESALILSKVFEINLKEDFKISITFKKIFKIKTFSFTILKTRNYSNLPIAGYYTKEYTLRKFGDLR